MYTLNCEDVHSSASDSGHIGFIGRCLTSKIPLCLLGFQNESDWIEFKSYEKKGHSQFELGNVHSTSWDPHNPAVSLYVRGLWKQALKQLNSAFLISTKESFRLYVRDLSPNWLCRWRCEFSPGSSLSWIPAWEQPLWLCLGPSDILLPGQLPVETQMASVATIILWLTGPFSWTALPTVPVIQATMHDRVSQTWL